MRVAWNAVPTSNFDPRSVVARFFQKKDRESRPSVETYKNREFVSKLFEGTMKKYI